MTAHRVSYVVISLELQDESLAPKTCVNIIPSVELVNLVVISPGVQVLVVNLV